MTGATNAELDRLVERLHGLPKGSEWGDYVDLHEDAATAILSLRSQVAALEAERDELDHELRIANGYRMTAAAPSPAGTVTLRRELVEEVAAIFETKLPTGIEGTFLNPLWDEVLAQLQAALQSPSPVKETGEAAWLIESGAGTYWTGRDATNFGPLDEACRFARQDDAERVRCWLLRKANEELAYATRASEHIWLPAVQFPNQKTEGGE